MMKDSTQPFQYTDFVEGDHHVIRVLTLLPLEEGRPDSDPIKCYLDHVHICACALASGEPEESLISRKPTIFFDRYVRKRPEEIYPIEIAHSTTLYEECFRKPDPEATEEDIKAWEDRRVMNRLTKRVSKLFSSSASRAEHSKSKVDPQYARKMLNEGIANMIEHPEDMGGGFSLQMPMGGRYGDRLPPLPKRPKAKPRSESHRKFTWGNYIALSYSWGTEVSKNNVFMRTRNLGYDDGNGSSNDEVPFRSISVTCNLEAALRKFRKMRYFKQNGPIWIDALCINQKNETEKSEQLQLMPHIYGAAGNILVWLGEGSPELYTAMDIIQNFGKTYRTEWQDALDDGDPYTANVHREMVAARFKLILQVCKVMLAGGGPFEPVTATWIYEFFNLPYWRRLWIMQELAMGTADMAFVLGDRVTEWRYIRDTAFLIDAIRHSFAESLPADCLFPMTVSHVARIAQLEIRGHRKPLPRIDNSHLPTHLNSGPSDGPVKGSPLWQAFHLMAYSQCYNKQDRVFGILAIPGLPDLGIVTDVTKSAVTVYKEFTIACIKSSYRHPFGIFCLLEGIREVINPYESLPSWVPHLASERRTGIIEGHFRAGDKYHISQAMGFEELGAGPDYQFQDGNPCVYGCVLDTIDGLGGISASSIDIDDPTLIPGLTQVSNASQWPIEDPPKSSIWRCFVAGTDENETIIHRGYEELLDVFCEKEFASWDERDVPAQDFIIANAELLVNGRPLTSYLRRWTDSLDLQNERATIGYDQFFTEWEDARTRTMAARHTMVSRTRNKRLMVTGRGMLGLVPNSVIASDVVLLIKGHGRPVIASRLESRNGANMFCLKGEAFVDGMMAGEMMEDEVIKKWEWLTFI